MYMDELVFGEEIFTELINRDKRLDRVFSSVDTLTVPINSDGYLSLCNYIISQQVSIAAAKSIFSKFLSLHLGSSIVVDTWNQSIEGVEVDPGQTLNLGEEKLREAGLTRQKTKYILGIAGSIDAGELDLIAIESKDDEEVRSELLKLKGVGNWTVDMYLLFTLGRIDVFPSVDLGIQKGMKLLYDIDKKELGDKQYLEEVVKISDVWRPYRSVVTVHIWEWLQGFFSAIKSQK
ncbi:MAG: DNA-3-methyladenine glycosylase [Candidatus Kapaibacteriales bacterium]